MWWRKWLEKQPGDGIYSEDVIILSIMIHGSAGTIPSNNLQVKVWKIYSNRTVYSGRFHIIIIRRSIFGKGHTYQCINLAPPGVSQHPAPLGRGWRPPPQTHTLPREPKVIEKRAQRHLKGLTEANLKHAEFFNPIPCGSADSAPGGFSILARKLFAVGIWNFVALFRIDFRVLSQNLSKLGEAKAVLGSCKIGGTRSGQNVSGWNCEVSLLLSASTADHLR